MIDVAKDCDTVVKLLNQRLKVKKIQSFHLNGITDNYTHI